MATSKIPFTNLQLEILRLYAHQISENDLLEIKDLIGQYFAKRLNYLANETWERNGWTDQDIENILNDPNQ